MERKSRYLQQLSGLLRPDGKTLLLLVGLYALQTLCSLFMPYVMSSIVEEGIRNSDLSYVLISCGIMCALSLVALALALIINKISSGWTARFTVSLRRRIFEKVNTFSSEQFSAIGTGGLITRSTEDASWIEDTVGMLVPLLGGVPVIMIGGIVLSMLSDLILPLIVIGVTVPVLAITILIVSKMSTLWDKSEKYVDEQNRIMRERFSGVRVIRAFDREANEHERTKTATLNMCRSFIKANVLGGIIQPIAGLMLNLATIAVIYVGAVRLESSESLRVGDVVATIQYIALIINAILTISWTISLIPRDKVCLRRIFEILDTPMDPDEALSDGRKLTGALCMKNVSFRYPGAQANAIEAVDLDIADGEIVGIIGGIGTEKPHFLSLYSIFTSRPKGVFPWAGKIMPVFPPVR